MYIYQVAIFLEKEENLELECQLREVVESFLQEKQIHGELVSTRSMEITGPNFGKCANCGCPTSDWTKDNAVREVSNGSIVDGIWLCDICLPEEHPNAF